MTRYSRSPHKLTRAEWLVAVRQGETRTRGKDRLPRKRRPSPVRDLQRPSMARDRSEVRREAARRSWGNGGCLACYRPRGDNGTKLYCRACADKHAARCRAKRRADASPGSV